MYIFKIREMQTDVNRKFPDLVDGAYAVITGSLAHDPISRLYGGVRMRSCVWVDRRTR